MSSWLSAVPTLQLGGTQPLRTSLSPSMEQAPMDGTSLGWLEEPLRGPEPPPPLQTPPSPCIQPQSSLLYKVGV